MERGSGILLHISSLPGDYGCGSFGAGAKRAIDRMKECGLRYWQVLPFVIPDIANSPYKSVSAFAGNPLFIDLDILFENGLITAAERDGERQSQPYSAEFERINVSRLPLLKVAAERALEKREIAESVAEFTQTHPQIAKFCKYIATKEANGNVIWTEWTTSEYSQKSEREWQWIQYEFARQWAEIKAYAHKNGIKVIGDIPIYVDTDSADVWANREQFLVDENGEPSAVAGCPPDYFSEDGQLWGNPIYDWKKMEADGFKWWEERLRGVFEWFDAVRIDHFRGFSTYWSIPADAASAKEGKWEIGPGKPFADMVNRVATDCGCEVIAEDLGDISADVVELLDYSGLPGMRVIQFGFMGDYESTHQPHTYVKNCVAYSGTHDNNTLLGYLYELEPNAKRIFLDYCGYSGDDLGEGVRAVLRELIGSVADVAIMPIQDLLGYGKDCRMNTPGVSEGMWLFRVTDEQLSAIPADWLRRMNHIYRREQFGAVGEFAEIDEKTAENDTNSAENDKKVSD